MKIELIDYGYKKSPYRAHSNDSGADVRALRDEVIEPGETKKIPLGFGLRLPTGTSGLVLPRSSTGNKGIVSHPAPVDAGYTGEIHAILTNASNEDYKIYDGDRIAQIVLFPTIIPDFVDSLDDDRGNNGFGSTGI